MGCPQQHITRQSNQLNKIRRAESSLKGLLRGQNRLEVVERFASAVRRLGALTSKDWLTHGVDLPLRRSTVLCRHRQPKQVKQSRLVAIFTKRSRFPSPKGQERDDMTLNEDERNVISQHADRLLKMRDFPKTICPSEIARALSSGELQMMGASDWRELMNSVREIMWEKRQAGEIEVLQQGEVVETERLEDIKGPIRLRNVKK